MSWISPRAKISSSAKLIGKVTILGPSEVGSYTLLDDYVTIGYPTRTNLRRVVLEDISELDTVSSGSRIGNYVIIRRGSIVYEGAIISDYVETGHYVLIRERTFIGQHSLIGSYTVIDGEVRIGSHVRVQSGVYLPPKTVIEDNVFLGPFVIVTNDKYPPSKRLAGVIIRRGAIIGAGAVIIAGVEIGEYSVVAAGAVVTKDVRPYTVVAGVPARPISTRDEYEKRKRQYEKLTV